MSRSGQSSMILIILVILVILGIASFLLSFSRTISQSEYLNVYAHNLLLSVLRSDTGYNDANCRLVSDAISCRFFSPSITCGPGAPTCSEVAIDRIQRYLNSFEKISKNFKYKVIVESRGVIPIDPITDFPVIFEYWSEDGGDLENSRETKYTANERIQKILSIGTCDRDYAFLFECRANINSRPDCPDIIANDDLYREQYENCKRSSGSYTLKAQLILERR